MSTSLIKTRHYSVLSGPEYVLSTRRNSLEIDAMQDLIQSFLKSVSAILCCGAFIAVCTALVIVSRRSSVSRAWEPLVPVVNGTLQRKYMTAVLQGTYQDHFVSTTLLTGGAEDPDTFQIEMKTGARGANWLVKYGSKKLF